MNVLLHPVRCSLYAAVLLGSVAACGGNFVPGDSGSDENDSAADASTGGSDAGSDASTGGSGAEPSDGGSSTGGAVGTGGAEGTGGCCLAFPSCNGTDKQIDSEADCPVGAVCYSSTICCTTIWCMQEQPACDAIPVCEDDETQVSECPPGASCTERALCGTVIVCQQDASVCDPEDEPDRSYVATEPGCAGILFGCSEHTEMFWNDCGCGCEQPAECPDFVDCSPGGTPDPLCSSDECPYTARAQ